MEENKHCYSFEKKMYSSGSYDGVVDATYIIHLEGNGRFDDIIKRLEEFKPTSTIFLVINKGYKKCNKSEFIKSSVDDLIDANFQILKHSKNMNYDKILILEDDFIFNPKIKDPFHINNVLSFLKDNNKKPYYYLLGSGPILQIPYNYYNYRLILSGGAQAVIYNRNMIDLILSTGQRNVTDWDDLGIWFQHKYVYYIPLVYQTLPETENSKTWGINDIFIIRFLKQFSRHIINFLGMDKNVEPGHSVLYFFSKAIFFIVLFIILLLIYLGFKKYTGLFKYFSFKNSKKTRT
jgi:hypothetical protein